MQKGPHLVCVLFMLVGAEKTIMGWRNEMLGPRQEKVVNAGPVDSWLRTYLLDIIINKYSKETSPDCCTISVLYLLVYIVKFFI